MTTTPTPDPAPPGPGPVPPDAPRPAPRRVNLLAWAVAGGFLLRLVLLVTTAGTDDALIWESHGDYLRMYGFRGAYEALATSTNPLNHPPIPLLYAGLCAKLKAVAGVPFPLSFRLPVVLIEAAAAAALYRAGNRRDGRGWAAAAAWAWCPAAILIGSFHGNTDVAMGVLTMVAAHLLAVRRPGWAGLALAAAANVKIVPLLAVPALAAACADRRALARAAGGFAAGLLPFAVALVVGGRPFFDGVFGYKGYSGEWGVGLLLDAAARFPRWGQAAGEAHAWFVGPAGRRVLVGAAAAVAAAAWTFRRRWTPYQLAALVLATFMVVTPGFAVQYMAFPLAAVMAADRGRGVAYGLWAGACCATVYAGYWTGTYPAQSLFKYGLPPPAPMLGLVAWGVLCGFVVRTLLWPGTPPPVPGDAPDRP